MSAGEDFALSKNMQFRGFSFSGVLCVFVSLVLLNLLVKISIFSVEIIENMWFFLKRLLNSGCLLEVPLCRPTNGTLHAQFGKD